MWPARPSIWTLLKLCLSTALYPLHGYLDTLARNRQLAAQLDQCRIHGDRVVRERNEAWAELDRVERELAAAHEEAKWVTAQIEIETERRNRTLAAMRPRGN